MGQVHYGHILYDRHMQIKRKKRGEKGKGRKMGREREGVGVGDAIPPALKVKNKSASQGMRGASSSGESHGT